MTFTQTLANLTVAGQAVAQFTTTGAAQRSTVTGQLLVGPGSLSIDGASVIGDLHVLPDGLFTGAPLKQWVLRVLGDATIDAGANMNVDALGYGYPTVSWNWPYQGPGGGYTSPDHGSADHAGGASYGGWGNPNGWPVASFYG